MASFPDRILVATDGSSDSELAIQRAADLARETGAELHVVYVMVISYWSMPDTLSGSQFDRLKEEARKILDEQAALVGETGCELAGAHLKSGRRADEEVINLAEELEADMIVVGSRGAGTIQRALIGSDSESIVRHAEIPVLVVRSERRAG